MKIRCFISSKKAVLSFIANMIASSDPYLRSGYKLMSQVWKAVLVVDYQWLFQN